MERSENRSPCFDIQDYKAISVFIFLIFHKLINHLPNNYFGIISLIHLGLLNSIPNLKSFYRKTYILIFEG